VDAADADAAAHDLRDDVVENAQALGRFLGVVRVAETKHDRRFIDFDHIAGADQRPERHRLRARRRLDIAHPGAGGAQLSRHRRAI
jgi:hypothetical protein